MWSASKSSPSGCPQIWHLPSASSHKRERSPFERTVRWGCVMKIDSVGRAVPGGTTHPLAVEDYHLRDGQTYQPCERTERQHPRRHREPGHHGGQCRDQYQADATNDQDPFQGDVHLRLLPEPLWPPPKRLRLRFLGLVTRTTGSYSTSPGPTAAVTAVAGGMTHALHPGAVIHMGQVPFRPRGYPPGRHETDRFAADTVTAVNKELPLDAVFAVLSAIATGYCTSPARHLISPVRAVVLRS